MRKEDYMTAFSVVRFHVKKGQEEIFLEARRKTKSKAAERARK